jgi:hypothetical protein
MTLCFSLSDVIWSSQEPDVLLFALSGSIEPHKLRQFACACVRRVWSLLSDERSRAAVEAAEGHAEGLVSDAELDRMWKAALQAVPLVTPLRWRSRAAVTAAREAALAAAATAQADPKAGADLAARSAVFARASSGYGKHFDRNRDSERAMQSELLRDLLGDPFRRLPVAPLLPPHVHGLAEECDAGDAELFPLLADALEEIGQDQAAAHCRQPRHARGCHVLDWVLGRADGFSASGAR